MARGVIIFILFFIIFIVIGYLGYDFYMDYFKSPEVFIVRNTNSSQLSYESELQFYPNMKFNHLALSYEIGSECDADKKADILSAFSVISSKTPLSFYEGGVADIGINCGEQYLKDDFLVAGEGGPEKFIDTGKYNVILKGKIVLLYDYGCGEKVALHELLHVFGFDHSSNKNSIMYNISNCKQVLTDDIVDELNRLYSERALADLGFVNASAVKHGRYLDVSFGVRNQGLVNAEEVVVDLFYKEGKIEEFELGLIEFGAGKIITATNILLPSRDINEINAYIDKEGKISEIDKLNNRLDFTLS